MTPRKQEKKKVKNYLRASDKQVLIEFYKVQWGVIRDLDNLDWRVALIFIPLLGAVAFVFGIAIELDLKEISYYTQAIKAISIITYLVCLYGLWTVAKGQAHSILKFKTLSKIEEDLGYDHYIYRRENRCGIIGRFWPIVACRRFVLFIVYFVLGFLSYSMIVIPISDWELSAIWCRLDVWLIPLILSIAIVLIHYCDLRVHKRNNN